MNFFEETTLRLKQQLKLVQDRDVAEMLGLTARAWAGRKKNDSFPRDKLIVLAAQRRDLDIDVDYILTGKPMQVREGKQVPGAKPYSGPGIDQLFASRAHKARSDSRHLAAAQAQLVKDWLACKPAHRQLVSDMATRLAAMDGEPQPIP